MIHLLHGFLNTRSTHFFYFPHICHGCSITLAHRKSKNSKIDFFPLDNLPFKKISNPVSITKSGVLLQNGSTEPTDHILFATGYDFDYDFIKVPENKTLTYANRQVTPLFQHLLHVDYLSSLAFLAVNNKVVPFPLMDQQMRYLVYSWFFGNLPSEIEISGYFEELEKSNEGRPAHYLHELSGDRQWAYLDGLDVLMEGTNSGLVVEQRAVCKRLYNERCKRAKVDPEGYKKTVFEMWSFQ